MNTAPKKEQDAAENLLHTVDTLAGIAADHSGHLGSTVAQTDHNAEIVMGGTGDDVANRNGNEGNGAKENALNGAEEGACTGNVQQVNQGVLPAGQRDKVHAVLLCVGGSLAVIGTKDPDTELA